MALSAVLSANPRVRSVQHQQVNEWQTPRSCQTDSR